MNPFTIMRQNVEYVLENNAQLVELGASVRKWSDPNTNVADQPVADRTRWIRCETVGLSHNPYWANAATESTQEIQVVVALPTAGGLKLEDIEELFDRISIALLALRQDQLQTACPQFSRFEWKGGKVGVDESDDSERRKPSANMRWSQIGEVVVYYEETVADMQAR